MVALMSALLFGLSTPVAKILVGTVPPLLLAGLLYTGSGAGLILLLLGRRMVSSPGASFGLPRRREWLWLAGAIFFGGIAGPVALLYGLVASAASTVSLLLNLESVLTAVLAWFLFHENFDRRVMLGMVAIVAGGVLLVWTPGELGHASFGLILVALACLCWAIDNNLTRKVSGGDPVLIAGVKGLVAGGVNLGLALLLGQTLPPPGILSLSLALGFVGYGISLVLFILALRHLGAARAGAYFSVAPFFGAALAILLQGEPVTVQLVAAGLLMAAGVWLHLTERHVHAHTHPPVVHEHSHVHDEHHPHEHAANAPVSEAHTHVHEHQRLRHAHPHYPDIHHRHEH